MERGEVAPTHARVQTMVVVHGGRVVGVMQRVQLGRRFGPPELPPGTPHPAAECGQPQGGLSGLLDWAACLVRCMRSRHDGSAPHMGAQMGMVHMQMAHAAAAAGAAAQGQPAPLVRVVGGGATPGSRPQAQRWQWDKNMPMPAEQQGPTEDDMFDSATAQQLLGSEPAAGATAAAEPEPQAAPWWWPLGGHVRRPVRGAEAAEAEGCRCKHCGCKHHHHHHHHHEHHKHRHSHEEQAGPAQQLPLMMAALHDLAAQRAQQAVQEQHAHRAARHGNHQLLPGVATPVELIARERAKAFDGRWNELRAAEQTAPSGMNWSLWDASGRLNWGLAAFVALAVACAAVWSAMLAQCTLYRSARANNNAAEVLAAQYYHHMPSDEAEGGDSDLKPLLREGPVKGAIAVVNAKL